MRVEFDIPDEKVQNLSPNGKSALIQYSKKLTEDIVDEASRIEASRRSPDTNTEITAAIINDAAHYSRRFVPKPTKSKWTKIIQIASFVATMIAGAMLGSILDTTKVKTLNEIIWFLIVFLLAIVSAAYLIFNNESNGQ
ncbi:AtpZ/AtpI family protein [Chitinophaga varians]|uniref:AtpZ/AtpI family protein n=1 Tax=Chitinophaga varians TaxID=2202339 RepID=UPI00165EEBBA|nr:AtpZ/AtpI family protein [Chitinophaga varians]MBC9915038.1 AtpZ/AtpI family protein [Chitinophaga varians]